MMRVSLQTLITCMLLCCATVQSSEPVSSSIKLTAVTPFHETTRSGINNPSSTRFNNNTISTQATVLNGGATSETKGTSTPLTQGSTTSITSQPATTMQTDGSTHAAESPNTTPDITQTTNLTATTNATGSTAGSTTTSMATSSMATSSNAPTIPQTHNPTTTRNIQSTVTIMTSRSTQTNRPSPTTQKISTTGPTIITTKTIHTTTLEQDEHKPEGLSSGSVAVIFCFVIALVLIMMSGLYYYKIRRRSYGPLLDNTNTGIGHFSNPMYDP